MSSFNLGDAALFAFPASREMVVCGSEEAVRLFALVGCQNRSYTFAAPPADVSVSLDALKV